MASAALAAAIALAGCNTDVTPEVGGRHLQPLSERMLADIEKRNMEKDLPILVRIFKEESELEIWKENKDGRFALLRAYPICRWSGELGPKIKEGDRQAPEGFYTITPGLMNPNSQYYLAINMGYPNAYDRSHGRTGAFLMIHGDCSSRGCYAMTDEQISEIYALARELFFGGQKTFQIQAFPFRMTPINMAKHRNSPHMPFWKMLKHGYDHFEVTRLEPKIDVCERRYVFNAESAGRFSAADRCPAYKVPDDIAAAVLKRQRNDDTQIADLVNRGTPAAPVKMGVDGGMNQTFLSAVKQYGGPGTAIRTAAGTIPAHVNPPAETTAGTTGSTMSLASSVGRHDRACRSPRQKPRVGSAVSSATCSARRARNRRALLPSATAYPRRSRPPSPCRPPRRPKSEQTRTAHAKPADVQASPLSQEASADPQGKTAAAGLLSGAAPTMPSGGFDGRFGAWR